MGEDLVKFLMAALIFALPFGCIYAVLSLLNWNDRKNLFFDSWFVFIAWILSSFLALCVTSASLLADIIFKLSIGRFMSIAFMITVFLTCNVAAIAAVLYVRSRRKTFSIISGVNDEIVRKPTFTKIVTTAALLSAAAIALMVSMIFTAKDIDKKLWNPNPESGFAIYD